MQPESRGKSAHTQLKLDRNVTCLTGYWILFFISFDLMMIAMAASVTANGNIITLSIHISR